MAVRDDIERFFAPPHPQQGGFAKSSLHQNRREVQGVFIRRAIAESQVLKQDPKGRHSLFATCMVIGAGIDLLSKFHAGGDKGGVGVRFKTFLEQYMFKGRADAADRAAVVYEGVRCPMVHSFTLHSKKHHVSVVSHVPELERQSVWRSKKNRNDFMVSVEGLFADYVKAIRAYKRDLLKRPDLQKNFAAVLPDYGYIRMSRKVALTLSDWD